MEMMMNKNKLEGYAEYKDSGEGWLGQIPNHWDFKRVKNIFQLITEPAPQNNDYELLSIYTDIGVKPRKELAEKGNKASTTDGYWIVKKGDFIINKLLAWMGAIGISEYSGVTSPAYDILRPKLDINGKYYHYLFRMKTFSLELKRHSKGIMEMRLRLYFDKFGVIQVPFPSFKEQNKIVSFLDDKCAKIDQAIQQKEQLIELLKERKQIIIQNAVTRGLNPDVKMKDSGVDWIGEIPEGWEVCSLKWLCKRYAGGTPDKSNLSFWENGTIPWIASGEVNQEFIKYPTTYITKRGFQSSSARWIPHDSLVVALAGQGKTKGMVAYLEMDTTGNQSLAAIIPNKEKISSMYLFFFLKASYKELRGVSGEGKRDGLNLTTLGELKTTIPPQKEQKEIISFITKQSKKISKSIALQTQQIAKLKEYKQVLINEVVMGKVKV